MEFSIREDICTFCGLCAEDCPANVIRIDKKTRTARINNKRCIECGHCGMICPVGAVRADGKELPEYPKWANGFEKAAENTELFEHLILSKRSIRKYTRVPISGKDIEAILLAGQLTATATNSRQVDSIVIQGQKVQQTAAFIAGIFLRVLVLVQNPIGIGILRLTSLKKYADRELLDYFAAELHKIQRGESDILFFNAPAVVILTYQKKGRMFGRTDCALAGQNMMLTAHSRGIGSCMVGFAEAALWNGMLRKRVGISTDRRIGLIFTLGHTDRRYRRYPIRTEWKAE